MLGENYTEQAISERVLANRHPRRPLENTLKIEFFGFTSYTLRGLYLHYCCLLGIIQKDRQCTYHSPSLRADLRKLNEFTAQAGLLCKYKIDTLEQLQSFIDNTKLKARLLSADCDKIYAKISRNTDEDKLPELIAKRNGYTHEIKALCYDLKNANAIMERSEIVKGNIQTVQNHELDTQKIIIAKNKREELVLFNLRLLDHFRSSAIAKSIPKIFLGVCPIFSWQYHSCDNLLILRQF